MRITLHISYHLRKTELSFSEPHWYLCLCALSAVQALWLRCSITQCRRDRKPRKTLAQNVYYYEQYQSFYIRKYLNLYQKGLIKTFSFVRWCSFFFSRYSPDSVVHMNGWSSTSPSRVWERTCVCVLCALALIDSDGWKIFGDQIVGADRQAR